MLCDVCAKFMIPRPYTGYWTLLAKGKSPEITPLPANDDLGIQSLTFYYGDHCVTTVNQVPRELLYDQEVQELLEKARKLGPLDVPVKLNKPHRLVVNTKAEDDLRIRNDALPYNKRSYPEPAKRNSRLAITVSNQQLGRAYRIMDAVIKWVEVLGGEVRISEPKYTYGRADTEVWFCGELVGCIRIREKQNQKKIVNPKAEYSWERERTELIPNGKFVLETADLGFRRIVAVDREGEPIEDALTGILIGFIHRLGEERLDEREKGQREQVKVDRERERLEKEAELSRRKAEFEKRKSDEQAKVDELVRQVEVWQQAASIRSFLDMVSVVFGGKAGAVELNSGLANYLKWGAQIADRIDPLKETPRSILDEEFDVSR